MGATTDGSWLVVAGHSGAIRGYNLQTGALVWQQNQPAWSPHGISISADGHWFAAASLDGLRVGSVQTGQIIQTFRAFAPGAALYPGGSKGAMIVNGRLQLFDVPSGNLTGTGIRGHPPICYSSDGKYLAFSNGDVKNPALNVLPSGDPSAIISVAVPDLIGRIKAAPDGRFLITATSTLVAGPAARGLAYDPASNQLQTLWQTPAWSGATPRPIGESATDFDVTCEIGVSTNWNLMTDVIDLQKGTVLYTINNSANSPFAVWQRRQQRNQAIAAAIVGLGLLAAVAVATYGIRRFLSARHMDRRGFECLTVSNPGQVSSPGHQDASGN